MGSAQKPYESSTSRLMGRCVILANATNALQSEEEKVKWLDTLNKEDISPETQRNMLGRLMILCIALVGNTEL
jgi:hypothetical protein